jgi:hypothetical protein
VPEDHGKGFKNSLVLILRYLETAATEKLNLFQAVNSAMSIALATDETAGMYKYRLRNLLNLTVF